MDSLPQAVTSCHELLVWMIPQINKFKRVHRFTLGERLENNVLEVLELLVQAAYSAQKRNFLAQANTRLAVCRHLWRACYELKVIPLKTYEYGAKLIDNVGRQIGGWMKSRAQEGG